MHFDFFPEPQRTLRVGHDLDGCWTIFDAAWYKAAVRLGRLDPARWPYRPAQHWHFYRDYEVSDEKFLAICHEAADKGLLWASSLEAGGMGVWQSIAADGHEIHVITDRKFGSHPIASEVGTYAWLHNYGLTYHSVTFSADKTCVPVDVMIEDKLDNYDALEECGVRVYLLDRPWNHVPGGDNRRRIYSLDEWLTRVRAFAAVAEPEVVIP